MGNIQVIGKWDLTNGTWKKEIDQKEFGRSFAIATYEQIIQDSTKKMDYIIVDQGSRVEDHSKDFMTIHEKEVRMDYIIEHYKHCNENYAIQLFLMDADAPIVEDARLFAHYIDSLAVLPTTNTINIIGLSKCSAMNFYVPKFFKCVESYQKTNMYNIAAPYTGTKLASPLIFYPEVKQLIYSKIGENRLADAIYKGLIGVYEGISSNSHMDYDIAIPGGIPKEKFAVYDPSFIENIFSKDNVSAVQKLNCFKNILTGIDHNTLKEAMRTMNFTGIGLCLLDQYFFQNKSDGMVYVDAQRVVESVLDIQSNRLVSTHHDVNSNIRAFGDVLRIVDDTIGETNEKKRIRKI